jgi:pilus assembly protein CpaB
VSANAVVDPIAALGKDRKINRAAGPKKGKAPNVVILLAIVLLLAIGITRMSSQPQETPGVTVVAAAKDVPAGYCLRFRDLHQLVVPKAYYRNDMATDYSQLVGRTTNTFIAMGEPIMDRDLLPKTNSVAQTLAPNQRAIALKLAGEYNVDNAAQAGDLVDVLSTTTGPNGKKYTKTICQNVSVLLSPSKDIALSDRLRGPEQDKVTLAVSPEQAERISEAVEVGKIRLVLRSPSNHATVVLAGADERDLLPHDALRQTPPTMKLQDESSDRAAALPPPPLPLNLPAAPQLPSVEQVTDAIAAPAKWVVEVFQGPKKETYEFQQHP